MGWWNVENPYREFMRVNLLIIEADSLFRSNLAKRLPDENWVVLFADQPAEAMKIIKIKNVDVVLLGLKDLKREGLVLLKRIKKIRPLTEIITINSPEQIDLSIEGMRLGAFDDFIIPFELESIVRRIREAHLKKTGLIQKKKDNRE